VGGVAQNTRWATQPAYFKRVLVHPVRVLRIKMTGVRESRRKVANPGLPGKWLTKQPSCECHNNELGDSKISSTTFQKWSQHTTSISTASVTSSIKLVSFRSSDTTDFGAATYTASCH